MIFGILLGLLLVLIIMFLVLFRRIKIRAENKHDNMCDELDLDVEFYQRNTIEMDKNNLNRNFMINPIKKPPRLRITKSGQ